MNQVYMTSIGKFLPGSPVSNDEIEDYLGKIGGKTSKTKRIILEKNQIRYRYYAMNKEQQSLYTNAEMAALAIRDAIERNENIAEQDIGFLATGTTRADLLLPGFASMVHAEAGLPVMEISSHSGLCASGMQALKYAYLQIKSGEQEAAVACASEFLSREFKHTKFEAQSVHSNGRVPFDTDFLRFMLSDGAGAAILQDKPSAKGLSLRIEWIDNKSYANEYDVCMYSGMDKDSGISSWLDYASIHEAADQGALNLKQDVRLVNEITTVGVRRFLELVQEGRIEPETIDWMVCHYSSHFFRDEIFRLLEQGGVTIPAAKWFTNLYTKGNTASASIYIMLEELMNEGHLMEGQQVLCIVPESGRFQTSIMMLTAVGPSVEE
ncbi:3-oxoacyl-(acyl carrier protein) synthase III [Paenibacillus alvei TS-15]|uniref:3-oxoacyl-(Acyl carrier protein) synthase III n=1 Tax=Paenibacillus alvei TS-15 TaxID=1117108 RepID=S9SS93_PAEAL|nr:beta-ketoacyl-ACP synthase III [Paenibacillus alvei]EPY08577.1 3-oxoacyl-(acyl carrier protein) synthase III [Paenibacillus alvei TS-15]